MYQSEVLHFIAWGIFSIWIKWSLTNKSFLRKDSHWAKLKTSKRLGSLKPRLEQTRHGCTFVSSKKKKLTYYAVGFLSCYGMYRVDWYEKTVAPAMEYLISRLFCIQNYIRSQIHWSRAIRCNFFSLLLRLSLWRMLTGAKTAKQRWRDIIGKTTIYCLTINAPSWIVKRKVWRKDGGRWASRCCIGMYVNRGWVETSPLGQSEKLQCLPKETYDGKLHTINI